MKPTAFDYYAPSTLKGVLELKAQHGEDAKPLAGGQSLIPTMNFRVTQPSILVDLNAVDELRFIEGKDGDLRIGAMTTQNVVERSELVSDLQPLIAETIPYVAHPQIRNRGTFGGSLAHADPASELPAIALALNAKFKAVSLSGERWVEAQDFLITMFTVDLQPDEILAEIAFPNFPKTTGWSFMEVSRRMGDYAMAGVAALLSLDAAGKCEYARLVYLNVGDKAMDAVNAAGALVGEEINEESINAAAEIAGEEEIDPFGSVHASPEYQRHLSKVVTRRALREAHQRASNSVK
ncbi:MAG: xanthine dehydrogenase family protein subunit M [Chloroflexota bacterium]